MERVSAGKTFGLLTAVLLTAAAALSLPARAQEGADPGYRIGPNDEIRVEVMEDAALNVQRRVSAGGAVNLPLVGELQVAGLTAEEAGARLETALERDFLRQATVTVAVVAARSRPITILGAVQRPGTVYLTGDWRLSQALAAVGGLSDTSRGAAEIRRQSSLGLSDTLEVDLEALLRRGDESIDVPVFAGDVVNVQVASDVTVYFLGEISSQGAITISGTERATLLTAIARAGGLTDRASSKLTIRRERDGDGPLEISANFRRILAGTDPDIELEDGDLIIVKEAFL